MPPPSFTHVCVIFFLLLLLSSLPPSTPQTDQYIDEADIPAYTLFNQAVDAENVQRDTPLALSLYKQSLSLKPDLPEALLNLGCLYDKLDDLPSAIATFTLLISSSPPPHLVAGAYNNLGHISQKRAALDILQLHSAISHFEQALTHLPTHTDSLYNLAKSYQTLGQLPQAQRLYQKILTLTPLHYESRLNLANYYFSIEDSPNALFHYNTILADSNPNRVPANPPLAATTRDMVLNNRGNLYRAEGRHDLALLDFTAASRESSQLSSSSSLTNWYIAKRTLTDWEGIDDLTDEVLHAIQHFVPPLSSSSSPKDAPLLPYDSLLIPSCDPTLRLRIARLAAAPYNDIERPPLPSPPTSNPPPSFPSSTIPVAYFSYDFRDHPMGHLTHGLIANHAPSSFPTILLSYGPPDSSLHAESFRRDATHYIAAHNTPPLETFSLVAQHSPKICVDLMSHTTGGRAHLAALKPCPILVNYLGYPGTSGGTYYDYIVVDGTVAPVESASTFSEKLIILPHTYQANEYDFTIPVGSGSPTTTPHTCLCNFNTIDKYESESFRSWMNMLTRNERAVLHLLRPSDPLGSSVVQNLHLEAMGMGVHPRRVMFLPRLPHSEHVERIGECDAFVDHFAYGGHTTTSDFLWAGTPAFVVGGYGTDALSMGPMASRVGKSFVESLMTTAEPLFVADTVKSLENTVAEVVEKRMLPRLRAMLTEELLRRPHFDTVLITRNIEESYRCAMELEEPMHIAVKPDHENISKYMEEAAVNLVVEAIEGGNAEAAAAVLDRLVHSFGSTNADVHHLKGLATDSPASIERAIEIDATVPFYHSNLAALCLRKGDKKKAADAYMRAIRLNVYGQLASGNGKMVLDLLKELNLMEEEAEAFQTICDAGNLLNIVFDSLSKTMAEALGEFFATHAQIVNGYDKHKSAEWFRVSMAVDEASWRHRLKLGAALEAIGEVDAAIAEFFRAVRDGYAEERRPIESLIVSPTSTPSSPVDGRRKVLAIYCDEYGQTWWPNWSHRSLKTGMGGSEEAAYFMAHEMADLGYTVVIYNDVSEEDRGRDPLNEHVFWRHFREYDANNPPDVFVAWRYHISLGLALGDGDGMERVDKVFLWLQDAVGGESFTTSMCERVDGIFVLSEFHKSFLSEGACRDKGRVTPNGIDVKSQFNGGGGDGKNEVGEMVYGSAPNRGLELLLDLWPEIFERLGGGVRLNVYYGFSKSFVEFGLSGKLGDGFEKWMEGMLKKLHELEGVEYRGMVSHEELVRAYSDAGYILYPSVYPETGCVTLMKAMCAGAVPVTSRCKESVVGELGGEWDLGPEEELRSGWGVEEVAAWGREYVERVIAAVEGERRGERRERERMKRESRARFSWAEVGRKWKQLMTA